MPLAIAVVTVFLCLSKIAGVIREYLNFYGVLNCTFCTSFWITLLFSLIYGIEGGIFGFLAVLGAANIAISLIIPSMGEIE